VVIFRSRGIRENKAGNSLRMASIAGVNLRQQWLDRVVSNIVANGSSIIYMVMYVYIYRCRWAWNTRFNWSQMQDL
jgi:hypothetical protein